tara:strand:+ start:1795 stop:2121 length:327 start_codon:yes stop_codon:yes gene_type:complete
MGEELIMPGPLAILGTAGLKGIEAFFAHRQQKQQQADHDRKDKMAQLIGSLSGRAQQSQQQAQQKAPGIVQSIASDPKTLELLLDKLQGLTGDKTLEKFAQAPPSGIN